MIDKMYNTNKAGEFAPDYDMFLWSWGGDVDPTYILSVLPHQTRSTTGATAPGRTRPTTPCSSKQASQIDQQQRKQTIWEMQKILYEQSPYIPLVYPFDARGLQQRELDRLGALARRQGRRDLRRTTTSTATCSSSRRPRRRRAAAAARTPASSSASWSPSSWSSGSSSGCCAADAAAGRSRKPKAKEERGGCGGRVTRPPQPPRTTDSGQTALLHTQDPQRAADDHPGRVVQLRPLQHPARRSRPTPAAQGALPGGHDPQAAARLPPRRAAVEAVRLLLGRHAAAQVRLLVEGEAPRHRRSSASASGPRCCSSVWALSSRPSSASSPA